MKNIAWLELAACRGKNPDLWDEDAGPDAVAYGKAICGMCTVRDACALDGLAEIHTVRTGLTAIERGTARKPVARNRVGAPPLSTEADERRMKMWKAGLFDTQIAATEGRAVSTIVEWRSRHGLPKNGGTPRLTEAEIAERQATHDEGLTDLEGARRVGISYNSFKSWRQRAGLVANGGAARITAAEAAAKRRQAYDDGATDQELAELMGVTAHAIRNWRLRQGLTINKQRVSA